MPSATTHFTHQQAPCGRIGDGDHLQDQDEQCLVADEFFYACGCRIIRHEYHDGSVSRRVIRHDGKVMVDEFIAEA